MIGAQSSIELGAMCSRCINYVIFSVLCLSVVRLKDSCLSEIGLIRHK